MAPAHQAHLVARLAQFGNASGSLEAMNADSFRMQRDNDRVTSC